MTGPEHYDEAERLIGEAHGQMANGYTFAETATLRLAEAQVHATLAVASATIAAHRTTSKVAAEWMRAISPGASE